MVGTKSVNLKYHVRINGKFDINSTSCGVYAMDKRLKAMSATRARKFVVSVTWLIRHRRDGMSGHESTVGQTLLTRIDILPYV